MSATHTQLTEPSVSRAVRTHDRKGREGKGREKEGKGARVETSHHTVTYVPEASAAAVEVAPRNDVVTDFLTSFYADEDIPCEGLGCIKEPHPADYIVDFLWPHGCRYRGPRCHVWWTEDLLLQCCTCPPNVAWDAQVEDVCRIVEVLR